MSEEISLSIEETNILRAKLGLKPLRVAEPEKSSNHNSSSSNQSDTSGANSKRKPETEAKVSADELRRRITDAKNARSTAATPPLAATAENDSLAEWIRRSRQSGTSAAAGKSGQRSTTEKGTGAAYSENDLEGIKVTHAVDIGSGESVVMTLVDRGVLDDGDDALENIEIAESERLRKAKEAARKKTIFEEAEEEMVSGKRGLLSKYNDDNDDAAGFVIGKSGNLLSTGHTQSTDDRDDFGNIGKISYSLDEKITFANDFLTGSEAALLDDGTSHGDTFKRKKRRTKSNRQQTAAIDDEDLNDIQQQAGVKEENSGNIADFLEQQIKGEQEEESHHGSRKRRREDIVKKEEADLESKNKRLDDNYLRALEKSAARSSSLKASTAAAPAAPAAPAAAAASFDLDDDDLAASLARARRTAAATKRENTIAQLLQSEREDSSRVKREEQAGDDSAANVVFNDVTEFVRALGTLPSAADDDHHHHGAVKREAAGDDHPMDTSDNEMAARIKHENDKNNRDNDDDSDDNDNDSREAMQREEGEVDAEGSDDVFAEPVVTSSLSSALSLLRQRGNIGEREQLGGRRMDQAAAEKLYKTQGGARESEGPVLEYVDDFGRKLTPKEAYRQISYRFHGQTPGKNKLAKKLKKIEQERAKNQDLLSSAKTFQSLQKAQQQKGVSHLVLSGSSSAAKSTMLQLEKK